jgi:hypothetical protein
MRTFKWELGLTLVGSIAVPSLLGCWRNEHPMSGEINGAASDEIGTRSDVSRSVGRLTRGAGRTSDYGSWLSDTIQESTTPSSAMYAMD